MFIFGIIAAGLAVLLSVVGFVIITFGLWRSFALDAFNRAIYLGLALISTAAIIFSLSGPIFAGGLLMDMIGGQNGEAVSSEKFVEPEPVVEEEVPVAEEDAPEADDVDVDPEDEVSSEGFDVSVTNVEFKQEAGDEYSVETAQGQYVLVYVDIVNNTGTSVTVDVEDFSLIGDDGTTYSTSWSMPDTEDSLIYEDINPGNTISGVIIYDIPEDSSPHHMVYEESFGELGPIDIALV